MEVMLLNNLASAYNRRFPNFLLAYHQMELNTCNVLYNQYFCVQKIIWQAVWQRGWVTYC